MMVGSAVLTAVVMQRTTFWDIIQCSPLKSIDDSKHIASVFRVKKQAETDTSVNEGGKQAWFHAGVLLGLFFETEDGTDAPSKRRFTFNGLHGVISQKTVRQNE
jgi:hypothetical protein